MIPYYFLFYAEGIVVSFASYCAARQGVAWQDGTTWHVPVTTWLYGLPKRSSHTAADRYPDASHAADGRQLSYVPTTER